MAMPENKPSTTSPEMSKDPSQASEKPSVAQTVTNPAPDAADSASSKPKMDNATIFIFVGLIVFFILMGVVIYLIWPYLADLFEEGGLERVTSEVRNAGWAGVFILLAFQFLQIVVAFIPGEVVQMAAGIIYGPWWGALIILIGCIISSAFIFGIVHKLGAPFVQAMVSQKYMSKLRHFESSPKFNTIVFILFLIPGMPKDVFTYILPLSHMRLRTFVILTNTARIPGIVVSTYAANGLIEGRIWESIIIFLVLAAIAGLALLLTNRFMNKIEEKTGKDLPTLDDLD